MTPPEQGHREHTLEHLLGVIRRYKALIVVVALIVPAAALVVSLQQAAVYQATSEVLLSRQDLGSALTGIRNDALSDAERYTRTQAELARVPEVAQQAIRLARVAGITPTELLDNSDVSARVDADLLRFTVDNRRSATAARLASAYAQAFTAYKLKTDTTSLAEARRELEGQLADLRGSGATNTDTYRDLAAKAQDLRTLELLQARATVVKPATDARRIKPTPVRNTALAVVLGLMIGIGIALLLNTLDKRVRDEYEVEKILDLPLLARLPKPDRGRVAETLPLLDGQSPYAEAVRRLRTNLELANLDVNAKVIMVTSAAAVEGKSTTIANLAVALARSGKEVALVDLDLRQPAIGEFFGLSAKTGVTDVALGLVDLEDALIPVRLPVLPSSYPSQATNAGGTAGIASGVLRVLVAGPVPANPGELVGTPELAFLLDGLRRTHDIVLVDAPPLLAVGDAVTISTRADAVVVVVRAGLADRRMLKELARALDGNPTEKLGFIFTGVDEREMYGTGAYGYVSHHKRREPSPDRELTSSRR